MDEPTTEMNKKGSAAEKKSTQVWRGSPRLWERCILCEVRKKCAAAGVARGSKACIDARYALIKDNR